MIDLMGNTVWTDAQIDKRVVALIRQKYSANDELKLARIGLGKQLGIYTPTPEEEAEFQAFAAHVLACREIGKQARLDNDLLRRTIAYEKAIRRLAEPVPDAPEMITTLDEDGNEVVVENPILVRDANERAQAQAIIDTAAQDVLDLAAKREAARITEADGVPVNG